MPETRKAQEAGFILHPRLDADTALVCDLPLCTVRLMGDSQYLWLILVPRRAGLIEFGDLQRLERHMLMDEIVHASTALQSLAAPDKLNVGALGNMVPQLHIHIIARHKGDAAWPGPVWGAGRAVPYSGQARDALLERLREALGQI